MGVTQARPADYQGGSVMQHVIPTNVVFDGSAKSAELEPEARQHSAVEVVEQPWSRQSSAPRDNPAAHRIRVPSRQQRLAAVLEPAGSHGAPELIRLVTCGRCGIYSQVLEAVQVKQEEQAAAGVGPKSVV